MFLISLVIFREFPASLPCSGPKASAHSMCAQTASNEPLRAGGAASLAASEAGRGAKNRPPLSLFSPLRSPLLFLRKHLEIRRFAK